MPIKSFFQDISLHTEGRQGHKNKNKNQELEQQDSGCRFISHGLRIGLNLKLLIIELQRDMVNYTH